MPNSPYCTLIDFSRRQLPYSMSLCFGNKVIRERNGRIDDWMNGVYRPCIPCSQVAASNCFGCRFPEGSFFE